ncbi:autotransporter domain-containing protein [Methylacidiphilales bacterium]|nr:autotransporter domain-containing protein [Candidatus Methylacidiphilales bacterium]
MNLRTTTWLAIIMAAGMATTAYAVPNLVANGGFETGDLTDWSNTGDNSVTNEDTGPSKPGPHSGTYYLTGGNVGSMAFIGQNLTTTTGDRYRLTYFMASDGRTPNEFQTDVGGVTLFDQSNIPLQGYTEYSFIFSATSASTLLQFGLRDDPEYLSLDDISVVLFATSFSTMAGLTPNQHALAQYLDINSTTSSNANLDNAISALLNVPASELAGALDQISPQSLQVLRHVAFDNVNFANSQLNNHLANRRDGLTGFDAGGLTVNDSTMDPALSQIKSRFLAWTPASTPHVMSDVAGPVLGGIDTKDMKSCSNCTATDPWSTFISGDVILADLSHTSDLVHSDYTTGSVTAGADCQIGDNFTLGALVAYAHTDADLDNIGSKATVDSYSPGIYGSYVDGGWYGNGMFSYGYNSYTETRNIDFGGLVGTNNGTSQGNQYSGNLTGGYEFHQGDFKFGPLATVQYVHLDINSIQEQGPTALSINQQDDDSLRSYVGFEGRYSTKAISCYGPLILTPHFSATWQHEYMDDSRGITSQFNGAGGGSFTVEADSPERDAAFLDVGVDAELSSNVVLFADYETQLGQAHYYAQSAQGGVRVSF